MRRRKSVQQPKELGTTIAEFIEAFPDEDACRAYLLRVRIADLPCPRCGETGTWRAVRGRPVVLHRCGQMRSLTAGSSLHRSRISLWVTFYAMLLNCNSSLGISGHFLSRHLGLSIPAAFRLNDRTRTQMALIEGVRQIGGPGENVYLDELLVGNVRNAATRRSEPTIIFGMRDNTRLVLLAVERRNAATLYPIIRSRVREGSTLVTDGYAAYKRLADEGWRHEVVNHSREWKNAQGFDQARIETIFRQIRRTLRGTHVHVGRGYLWKYLAEIAFRFNRRWDGKNRFWDLISRFPDATSIELDALRMHADVTSKISTTYRDRMAQNIMPTYR